MRAYITNEVLVLKLIGNYWPLTYLKLVDSFRDSKGPPAEDL